MRRSFLISLRNPWARLLQQLGSRYGEVLSECRTLLRAVFEQWHGYEVDTQGDAFVVVFAHATDAVSAAVTIQRALSTIVGWMVSLRVGLYTGEPEATEEGYVGLDVQRASRIMNAGHEHAVATAREQLGSEEFRVAWMEGG